jgi:hypothetical protein
MWIGFIWLGIGPGAGRDKYVPPVGGFFHKRKRRQNPQYHNPHFYSVENLVSLTDQCFLSYHFYSVVKLPRDVGIRVGQAINEVGHVLRTKMAVNRACFEYLL